MQGMKLVTALLLVALPYYCLAKVNRLPKRRCFREQYNTTIYDYSLQDLVTNETVPLSNYQGKQEPASNSTEILNGLKYVRPGKGFEPNFRMFKKTEVNGEKEHPLYTFLKSVCPSTRDGFGDLQELYWKPLKNWDVRWNFEKFLVDPQGRPYMRYDPSAEPLEKITSDIEMFLRSDL